jgi:GntR family transcriptional regulator, transcriptional repressor for pyruvate dehydrogenase complex
MPAPISGLSGNVGILMEPVETPKIADAVAQRIETLILEGVLPPGEKLAAERDLAEKLDVSRPTLRDAISMLAGRGLLRTTRSGTYVAEFLSPLMAPLASLLADKSRVTDDYFEFRRSLEGEVSRLAALRATDLDREAIHHCVERMTKAHKLDDPTEEAEADVELHLLVYEASHNVVLLHVMRALAELLRGNIFYSRQQLYLRAGVREKLLQQHIAIAESIIAGKPAAAKTCATEHIRYTFETVAEIRRDQQRVEASLKRVSRADFLARQD